MDRAMNSSSIDQRLASEITEPIRQGIVNAIDHAYFVRSTEYDSTVGDDNQYFGFGIFKSTEHFLGEFVSDAGSDLGIREVNRGQQYMLRAGEFLLAPYRIPATNPAQLGDAFPYNSNGAGSLAELNLRREREQSYMFSSEVEPDTGIVIAHTGDHNTGLTSVSLREPIGESDGRICEWGYVEFLYRDDEGSAGSGQSEGPSLPPEVPIPEPSVEARSEADSEQGE